MSGHSRLTGMSAAKHPAVSHRQGVAAWHTERSCREVDGTGSFDYTSSEDTHHHEDCVMRLENQTVRCGSIPW